MRGGRLRHQIVIESRTESQDNYGGNVASWATFATVRAAVEPLNGREYFAAAAVQKESTIRFRIRYLEGLSEDMRITFNGNTYDINSIINNDERNKEITIMTTQGVNDG